MKLKYYLRGLGIGILVTALVMGATGGKELTDQEIKAKALQLGMIEEPEANVLSDLQANADKQTEVNASVEESIPVMETIEETLATDTEENATAETISETQESVEVGKETESAEATTESEVVETKESVEATQESEAIKESEKTPSTDGEAAVQESTQVTESATAESSDELVTITVKGGDSSVSVSKALAAVGLVPDAKEYDRYLCSNGYDKRICVGTYEIALGSDYEAIAKIITKR